MLDKTVRELQALGYTVTLTVYPGTAQLQTPANAHPEEAQPAPKPPTVEDAVAALNNLAMKTKPEKAREILGEGRTIADITDPQAIIDACEKALP